MNPKHGVVKIKHELNKTVHFWPMGLDATDTHYHVNGWWIGLQIDGLLVQETIKIKKDDLAYWNVCE